MKMLSKLFCKKKKVVRTAQPKHESCEILTVKRMEEFIPYFVYSNKRNEIIDSIYLTEAQAFQLNKLMKMNENVDIIFLRK